MLRVFQECFKNFDVFPKYWEQYIAYISVFLIWKTQQKIMIFDLYTVIPLLKNIYK